MALIERNNWKYWTKSVLVSSVIAVLEWKMGEELDAVGIPNSGSSKWKLLNSRFVNQGVFLARPSINRLFLFNSGYSRIHHLCRIKIQSRTSRNNSYWRIFFLIITLFLVVVIHDIISFAATVGSNLLFTFTWGWYCLSKQFNKVHIKWLMFSWNFI